MPKPVRVVQYNINTEELYSYLKEFIHILYFRHLLVNPRDRRVVIIESVLCPSHFRETLTRVLFKYFEVPSVLLAPSHLMALLTLGINSAMVLDCGYRESLVLPISFLSSSQLWSSYSTLTKMIRLITNDLYCTELFWVTMYKYEFQCGKSSQDCKT